MALKSVHKHEIFKEQAALAKKKAGSNHRDSSGGQLAETTKLRIVAGTHRGRCVPFRTDPKTRPMKDRTREALFSRLGGKLPNYIAIDVFAGSGILVFESLSRGAVWGVAIEIDRQGASRIREAATALQLESLEVIRADCLSFAKEIRWLIDRIPESMQTLPWCVFFCPPYKMWQSDLVPMQKLIQVLCETAPEGSLFAIEFDLKTDSAFLPERFDWEPRDYPPACLVIGRPKSLEASTQPTENKSADAPSNGDIAIDHKPA